MSEEFVQTVYINSANRVIGTVGDFTVYFQDQMLATPPNTSMIMIVIDACISRSWYTVSDLNNTFATYDGVSLVPLVIPPGCYDVYTMRAALAALLGVDWTVACSKVTNTYTYTSAAPCAFVFSNNRCSELLGFGVFQGTTAVALPQLVGTSPIKMNMENSIIVHCDIPQIQCSGIDHYGATTQNFTESDIILKMPLNCAPYDNLVFQEQGSMTFRTDVAVKELASLRFYLTDENNVALTPMFDWTITLKFLFFKNDDDQMVARLTEIRDYIKLMVIDKHLKKYVV